MQVLVSSSAVNLASDGTYSIEGEVNFKERSWKSANWIDWICAVGVGIRQRRRDTVSPVPVCVLVLRSRD